MEEKQEEGLDLRQRKTRRQLTQALVELMEERPFQELSVTDICRRAMVHRTTFYAHFNDKQELLHYLMVQVERECIAACVPQDAPTPRQFFLTAARNALAFFKTRKGLYRACMASGAEAGPPHRRPLLRGRYALPGPVVAPQPRPGARGGAAGPSGPFHSPQLRGFCLWNNQKRKPKPP